LVLVTRKLKEELLGDMFVHGFLHDQIENGEFPDYGYPHNHLPPVTSAPEEMTSCFELALQN
jgi:hypothetical protein